MENWENIKDYEGLYQVSDQGRVRGLDRVVTRKDRRTMTLKGRILKPVVLKNGYLFVILNKQGNQTGAYIHRLVLTAFVGPCPEGCEGCHNDGDRINNHVENLRWDTRKANHSDKVLHGTTARGEKCCNSKLTVAEVLEIRRLYATGKYLQRELGDMFGGRHQMTISDIITRKTWFEV